ncbi:amidohydrolase [Paenibacillus endoradicis]|uniref:amidohydrolase n=1 Tax=Paenibacillus endoradicis TaxID=2972487 RepID=UPI0021597526|nr:amidohydrolase [Paenibacillus endoradicis]MCR8656202.1 amidohydrolase [Paenibacillus endoradicis]
MTKSTSLSSAKVFSNWLSDIRRELHRYPELSDEEFETTAKIRKWLENAGIRIVDYSLHTGVIAEVGGLNGGSIIALRADIDALPIQESSGLSFASVSPGKMHACGHDYHTAVLIGTAILLKEHEEKLNGTIRLIFQPAEEKATGAREVINSGALEGVTSILGFHNKPDYPVGTVGIKGGALMAAPDRFSVDIEGKGTHAAVPESGIDPINVASHIVTALQSIVTRNVSALDHAVISVTKFQSGTTWNVIPDRAYLEGTIRTFDEVVRRHIIERFDQVVEGVATSFNAKASVHWIEGPPAVHNDDELAELAWQEAEELGLIPIIATPSLAGEDFSEYQQKIPGLFVFIGTAGNHEWHHPAFDLDERSLPIAVDFIAGTAKRMLLHANNKIGSVGFYNI